MLIKVYKPCTGETLKALKQFLKLSNLIYEKQITETVIIFDINTLTILATGSCYNNVFKCISVAKSHRGEGLLATVMSNLMDIQVSKGIVHNFLFTKPENETMFADIGFYKITQTHDVVFMENKLNGMQNYLTTLKNETENITQKKEQNSNNIGCIIANCNPFTKGHKYLIEKASKECDYLHLFIVSENNQMFDSTQRLEMVKRGLCSCDNLILHETSEYQISSAVFPNYFIKDDIKAQNCNYELDLHIFVQFIAKTLNINKRYVGSEPFCKVTKGYNEYMMKYLPENNIKVIQIERLQVEKTPISASQVRKAFFDGNTEIIQQYLPKSTKAYLLEKGYFTKI